MTTSHNRIQRRVALGMVLGIAITLATTTAVYLLGPISLAASEPVALLRVWLALSVLVLAWLVVAVARLAKHRFFSSEDIDAGAAVSGSTRAQLLQSILQNTLEQSVLAVTAYGAWLFLAPERWKPLALACAGLYSLGRLLFFLGYSRGASARALGFALTFYPTVAMLGVSVVFALGVLLPT